ncbi:OmpP1/FadL family transporter [Leisingera sp. NJS204]|uniref:OmpP1/FadL family transporter n=1 Tax=Leisingera sp. NJS204 TaxID=2508307 RepID=UPI0013E91812|nr:outer membrane protein transport protein [Leisingera sp. NJS204]
MLENRILSLPAIVLAGALSATQAWAAGFERTSPSVDRLFTPGNSAGFSTTFVVPTRKFTVQSAVDRTGAPVTTGARTSDPAENLIIFEGSVKMDLTDRIGCLFGYNEPLNVNAHFSPGWQGRFKVIDFEINMRQIRTACSYRHPLAKGALRFIAGVGAVKGDAIRTQNLAAGVVPGTTAETFSALDFGGSNTALSWQAGLAYELPEKAFRVLLLYTSESDVRLRGDFVIGSSGAELSRRAIHVNLPVPQSLELKLQSGVAPGWLVQADLKWQEWSAWGDFPIFLSGAGTQIAEYSPRLKDGWSARVGVARRVNDKLGLSAFVKWDSSTSTGWTPTKESWTVGGGARYQIAENAAVTFGGAVNFQSSGTARSTPPEIRYSIGNDAIFVAKLGLDIKF